MKETLDVYELVVVDDKVDFISAMGVVNKPAIEIDFLKFNKNNKFDFKIENNEKKIITGPALIPDKKIYRWDIVNDKEYYVYFSKETIEKLSHDFLINNFQNNINLEHEIENDKIKLIESWLSKNDNELDLGLPIGTWFVSYKVEDDEIWNKIKLNEFNGFSVEVFSHLKSKLNNEDYLLKKIIDMNEFEIENLISIISNL